ncbi:MAG: hypothetical protein WCD79_06060 [Chthoniobacteraceae bacterium]
MNQLSLQTMRGFLTESIATSARKKAKGSKKKRKKPNEKAIRNKLYGLLAEVHLRTYLEGLGFGNRVSRGGWIARRTGAGVFAHNTAVFFPEIMQYGVEYGPTRKMPQPDHGLHTICSTFRQTGIMPFFCAGIVETENNPLSLRWRAVELGLPTEEKYKDFPKCVETSFVRRKMKYNFLKYETDTTTIPDNAVAEEFSKEHLRIAFQNEFIAEVSDVDGIFWGKQLTYPLEIKEKVPATDSRFGAYFGLDVGPFVKLAHYAALRGNLHSLFIVREINNVEERELVNWWYITFDEVAKFASWVPMKGGINMGGGGSSVVCIPKHEFKLLDAVNLAEL